MSLQAFLRQRLFGITPREALFARRGFPPADPRKQERLEGIGRIFIAGYTEALGSPTNGELARRLDDVSPELRGFAYEGAAMGLAIADAAERWRAARFPVFLENDGARHRYMLHVGYGWAAARLPWLRWRLHRDRGKLLHWLAVDGYGFHEGYFHWRLTIAGRRRPPMLRGYAHRAFDQGLGRALWFFNGADVERTARCVAGFEPGRRGDLWSGVGLAVAYAGGATPAEMRFLYDRAGDHRAALAQGAAFAAQARAVAGNPAAHTDSAACVFCGATAAQAARLTDAALDVARREGHQGAALYERWREELRHRAGRAECAGAPIAGDVDQAREAPA